MYRPYNLSANVEIVHFSTWITKLRLLRMYLQMINLLKAFCVLHYEACLWFSPILNRLWLLPVWINCSKLKGRHALKRKKKNARLIWGWFSDILKLSRTFLSKQSKPVIGLSLLWFGLIPIMTMSVMTKKTSKPGWEAAKTSLVVMS